MKGSFQLWLILVLALQTSDYWGFKESKYQNLGRNSQHSKAFNFFRQISKFVQIRGIFATTRGSSTVGDRWKESSASPEGGEHTDRLQDTGTVYVYHILLELEDRGQSLGCAKLSQKLQKTFPCLDRKTGNIKMVKTFKFKTNLVRRLICSLKAFS